MNSSDSTNPSLERKSSDNTNQFVEMNSSDNTNPTLLPAQAPKARTTVISSRNASTLGYGQRADGLLTERRRPSSSRLPNHALRREAKKIPVGDGTGLDDRQKMILCYLSGKERHKRASSVFNTRGEWYAPYRYMTLKDDAFLLTCDMPRDAVPRTLDDRPDNRNIEQVRLEEEDARRRRNGLPGPEYKIDEPGRVGASNGISLTRGSGPIPLSTRVTSTIYPVHYRRNNPDKSQSIYDQGPLTFHLPTIEPVVTLFPQLIELEGLKHLNPDPRNNIWTAALMLDLNTTGYKEICAAILHAFGLDKNFPGIPEFYVDTLIVIVTCEITGKTEQGHAYEWNWHSTVMPFMSKHFSRVSLGFGLAMAEEVVEVEEEGYVSHWDEEFEPAIDPALPPGPRKTGSFI